MTSNIEVFISNPSEYLLNEYMKDQLLALANHYVVSLSVVDKRLKEILKSILIFALVEQNVLQAEQIVSTVQSSRISLSYEQQKYLILIETKSKEKIEQEKIEAIYEIEKAKL